MSDNDEPKAKTYGALWAILFSDAIDVGLEFNANGARLTAEIVAIVGGQRISAHVLKRGGVAWFVGDENVTEQPTRTEHVTSFISAHRETLADFLSHLNEVAPEDSDYRRYVLGEGAEPEPAAPAEKKVQAKKVQAKKVQAKKSS